MKKIPKIIHQIWSDKYRPLPRFCELLAETWKKKHPDWEYIYWNEEMMNSFIEKEYPHLCSFYHSELYGMQQWDTMRFLILNKMGGMYVDFDYECLINIEPLLIENKVCCIATEPKTHCLMYNVPNLLNSALMASVPQNPYIEKIIDRIFSDNTLQTDQSNKTLYMLKTTGPLLLSDVYENLTPEEKETVYLIPAKNVTPFDVEQIKLVKAGIKNKELEKCLQEAYAVHYFTYAWGVALWRK